MGFSGHRYAVALTLGLAAFATVALAQEADPALSNSYEFVEKPGAKDFDHPGEAWRRGLFVLAQVQCKTIDAKGNMKCVAEMEAPPNMGMGKASVKYLEQGYWLRPKDGSQSAIGVTKRMIIPAKMGHQGIQSDGVDDYRVLPSAQQIRQAYPAKALSENISATVLVHCTVLDTKGRVTCDEKNIYSTAPGYGFEAATKALFEEHAVAARYYEVITTASGTKGRVYPPFVPGQLRQEIIRFTLP